MDKHLITKNALVLCSGFIIFILLHKRPVWTDVFSTRPHDATANKNPTKTIIRHQKLKCERQTAEREVVDEGAETYQQFPIKQHFGLSLQNFTAVDDFHRCAAT